MLLGVLVSGALGAIAGSFAGVVAERLHTGQSWHKGRSRCSSCNRTLGSRELLPIVSFLSLRGRCYTCGSRIPETLVITESVLALLFVVSYLKLGVTMLTPLLWLALTILTVIVLYDIRHTIVPRTFSTLLIAVSFVYLYIRTGYTTELALSLLTAGLIGAGFLSAYLFSRGKAMGLGDAPIAFALSLLVAPYAFSGLLFSFWIGAVIGVGLLVLRRRGTTMGTEVPFVPFLAAGYILAFFIEWNLLAL